MATTPQQRTDVNPAELKKTAIIENKSLEKVFSSMIRRPLLTAVLWAIEKVGTGSKVVILEGIRCFWLSQRPVRFIFAWMHYLGIR